MGRLQSTCFSQLGGQVLHRRAFGKTEGGGEASSISIQTDRLWRARAQCSAAAGKLGWPRDAQGGLVDKPNLDQSNGVLQFLVKMGIPSRFRPHRALGRAAFLEESAKPRFRGASHADPEFFSTVSRRWGREQQWSACDAICLGVLRTGWY